MTRDVLAGFVPQLAVAVVHRHTVGGAIYATAGPKTTGAGPD
jgi:hypothetical protein